MMPELYHLPAAAIVFDPELPPLPGWMRLGLVGALAIAALALALS